MESTIKNLGKVVALASVAIVAYVLVGAFVHAEAAPTITTSIRNDTAINTAITSATIGTNVRSVVQIASSTGPIPQGTVDFNVYPNTSCSGSATIENNIALTNGFATSTVTALSASGLSYKVHYDGDANNIASDGQCASLTATSNAVTISAGLTATNITAGQSVSGTSTLGGTTANASGTVAYTVFTNASCTTPYGGAGNVNVTNGVVPNSSPFQFITAGTYYWQAVYSGDLNNSAATSTCTSATLTVQAVQGKNSPTISTTLSSSSIQTGTSVNDSATLTGETANASGTVAYKIYTNNSCSNLFTTAGTKTVTNGTVPNSDNVQFNSAGTYYWQAVYSGDGQNNAATSTCSSEVLTVAQAGTTTPPTGAGTISGTVYNDKNKNDMRDSGEEGLAGFTINLYEGANFSGDYDPVFKSVTSDSNGNYSFSGLANGTYSVEQLIKTGWKQTTNDFALVVITSGAGVSGLNFGDVAKKNSGKDCKEKKSKNGKGSGKHKKDCRDGAVDNTQSSSTKPWWRNDDNNGWHWGWFKGNSNKHDNENKGSKHSSDD